jgi:Na+/H+-dicarboxylate symporter
LGIHKNKKPIAEEIGIYIMYELLLTFHSYLRWIVTILAIVVVVKAILGVANNAEFGNSDSKLGLFFMISCDIQLLIGLLLYVWYSPITTSAFTDFGAAMKNPEQRFWAVEHIAGMLLAWFLVHIGRARSKKGTDAARHKNSLIFYTLAIAIILASIPWATRPMIH